MSNIFSAVHLLFSKVVGIVIMPCPEWSIIFKPFSICSGSLITALFFMYVDDDGLELSLLLFSVDPDSLRLTKLVFLLRRADVLLCMDFFLCISVDFSLELSIFLTLFGDVLRLNDESDFCFCDADLLFIPTRDDGVFPGML